jgi:phosphoglycerol transferase MdoB-like AlkP superfamily enzyme
MRIFLFSLSLFCYAVLLMIIYRLGLPRSEFFAGYVDDLSFVLLLTTMLHVAFLFSGKKRVFLVYGGIVFVQLILIAEWWHYEFYRDYIHYASLGYVGSWREILKGITGFQGRYYALGAFIVLLGALYLLNRFFNQYQTHTKSLKYYCIVFGCSGVMLSGVITRVYADVTIESWQTKGYLPLEAKNPILEIFREKFVGRNKIARVSAEHLAALRDIYGERVENSVDEKIPFYIKNNTHPVTDEKKYNVVFIVLESFRDYEVGKRNGFSLTPNFDRISEGNFTPKYFYTNSNQTIKAEIALLCGQHDFLVGTSISAYDMNYEARCLPKIFRENGYNSYWFHGGYASFYGRQTFFPKLGFNELHDRATIENTLFAAGQKYFIRHWGVEDPYVFAYAFAQMEKQKQPFFAEIMSLSSHHPFYDIQNRWDLKDYPQQIKGDMNNMYRKYQHVTYYTDKALGQFWDAFIKSHLYDNTIVVIVGDHGIWLFPDGMEEHASEAQLYEAYTRLPLTIYFPGKHFSREITVPLSQVDVPALVTAYMGLDDETAFQSGLTHDEAIALIEQREMGKEESSDSLTSDNPVFATIGDGYFFRQEDMRCFPSITSKGECKDYLFRCVKKHNVMQKDQECFTWQGDLLHESKPVTAVTPNRNMSDEVVDYFRNALFIGAAPSAQRK